MRNSKKGFTLAEVLVTLAIIGVVAALTIPTLIQSTNSSKYQTSLKKALSVLNQALTTAVAQEGVDASSATDSTLLRTTFTPYLNVIATQGETVWLSDGSKISFVNGDSNACSQTVNPSDFAAATECYAIVDVNGDKGPNNVADAATPADVYILGITANAVLPVGLSDTAVSLPAEFVKNSSAGTFSGNDIYPADIPASNYASIAAVTGST